MTAPPLLTVRHLGKQFGQTRALDSISLDYAKGRIYGLAGENGAGKSTLIRILAGVHVDFEGTLALDGQPYAPRTPAEAERSGLAIFHQEIPVCPNLSVAANVFLGPRLAGAGWSPNWSRIETQCRDLFRSLLDVAIDPRRLMRDCTPAERQLGLLVRVLSRQARLVILDEPTTALTPPEVARLFAVVRRLRGQGLTFVFVSHLLDELVELADEIHVLRDGRLVGHLVRGEYDVRQLAGLVAGRTLRADDGSPPRSCATPRLEVRGLSSRAGFREVSFGVWPGEILGITGLQGSGRSALARALFGAPPADAGELRLDGRTLDLDSPADAIRAGIGYVPEDRRTFGLFDDLDIQSNLGILRLQSLATAGWLRRGRLRALAAEARERFQIKMARGDAPITSLSGGNQQKVLIARWLAIQPQVLVMHEPTRGVDVGAKAEIAHLIRQSAEGGCAFVVVSSDLEELQQLANRVLVMRAGRVVAEFPRSAATKERLLHASASGGHGAEPAVNPTGSCEAEQRN